VIIEHALILTISVLLLYLRNIGTVRNKKLLQKQAM